ncbi:hypothetical protein HMPREF3038_02911 [Akkermansia sp. KLE1797]|nr:hypothetical protein HMPREF3038_02911 [Akkermansia sp. KLE1797]KXU52622.1 hypothetical protein HMPREF3039_03144 [Akkermansia sp. KLE1798]KZA04052.1 hypothetical protein HMPREF1326_02247 [Akkermansia sp. KLE1605]
MVPPFLLQWRKPHKKRSHSRMTNSWQKNWKAGKLLITTADFVGH